MYSYRALRGATFKATFRFPYAQFILEVIRMQRDVDTRQVLGNCAVHRVAIDFAVWPAWLE